MTKLLTTATDDQLKLKVAYRERKKNNSKKDIQLENLIWTFLFELGYNELNDERECKIYYEDKERNVDIIASNEESRLFIEVTVQDNISKIDSTIGKFIDYAPFIQESHRNNLQIYFTNQNISARHIEKLASQNIQFLHLSTIEYLRELLKKNKRLALYQFYSILFRGQIVKSRSSTLLEIPALESKDQKGTFYVFSIKPSDLLPISTVPHRSNFNSKSGVSKSYQRIVDHGKIKKIKKYIRENKSFPTNLITNINNPKWIKGFDSKASKLGILKIEPRFGCFSIIDGQHRLLSYCDEEKADSHFLTVTAYVNLEMKEQIDTFVSINEKQKPVAKNLLWDLYPELYSEDDLENGYKVKISLLCKKLNEEPNSPLYKQIKYPSAPRGSNSSSINLNSFCQFLVKSKLFANDSTHLGSGLIPMKLEEKFNLTDDKAIEGGIFIIHAFFEASKNLAGDKWTTNKFYLSDQYMSSHILLLADLWSHIFKSEAVLNLESFYDLFFKYLEPVAKNLNSYSAEETSEFKKSHLGGGGPKSMRDSFLKIINGVHKDFFGDYINNLTKHSEIDRLIEALRKKGENSCLEAKESFFYDSKRYAHTGELLSNSDMTKEIVKTVVSFANGSGGSIILGIGDPKNHGEWKIVGLDHTDLNENGRYLEANELQEKYTKSIIQKISSQADDSIHLKRRIDVFVGKQEGLYVGVIKVEPISRKELEENRLYSLDKVAYYRLNDEKLPLKVSDINDYCSEKYHELYRQPNKQAVEFDQATIDALVNSLPKSCPQCNATANTFDELINSFGTRLNHGKIITQSYCRTCR